MAIRFPTMHSIVSALADNQLLDKLEFDLLMKITLSLYIYKKVLDKRNFFLYHNEYTKALEQKPVPVHTCFRELLVGAKQ